MSVGKIVTIWCDNVNAVGERPDGCEHWISQAKTTPEARREARAYGWINGGGEDFCPPCAAFLAGREGQ